MNCLSCGTSLSAGSRFCDVCGTAVADALGTETTGGATSATDATAAAARFQGAAPLQGHPAPVPGIPEPTGYHGGEPTVVTGPVGPPPVGMPMPEMAPVEPPPKESSAWMWFGIGSGGALLIALIAFAVFTLTGGSDSAETGTDVASDATSLDVPAPTQPPTTVIATVLSGVWPAPATWANDQCETANYVAVTSLETSNSKVVICNDDPSAERDGSYYYRGQSTGKAWSPILDATYDETAQEFVATLPGESQITYTVSPTGLRIDSGTASEFEFAENAMPHGGVSDDDLLAQLVNLMHTSSNGRAAVQSLANTTYVGNTCTAPADAMATIGEIIENRREMYEASERLLTDAGSGPISSAARDFRDAMQASLEFDEEFEIYIRDHWTQYAHTGCRGSNPSFDALRPGGKAAGERATTAKQALVGKVNALAAGTSLKHDWEYLDV